MLPEEATKLIGRTSDTTIFEVEKGAIRRYANAIGDLNPLYWDEEYAKNSRYGAMVAPPAFFGWPITPTRGNLLEFEAREELMSVLGKAGYNHSVAAGREIELFRPVRVGDRLTASQMIKNIVEKVGRTGKMAFVTIETTYTNQDGDLVAKDCSTSIR